MITIADCGSWQECQILKSKLEAAGIPVFVPDEMSNLDGLIMHFGGFRIQVADEDAATARALLETRKASNEAAEGGAGSQGDPAGPAGDSGVREGPPPVC